MPRIGQVLVVALVAAAALAALDSGAVIGQSSSGAVIEKRVEQGSLPSGQAGYMVLNCPRGYVATAGGFATSMPAIVAAATVIDRRRYAVVVYNLFQPDSIIVSGRSICIQGTVVRNVVAASASTASPTSTDSLATALQGARDSGYKVVRLDR
jgi:hypothetical protein